MRTTLIPLILSTVQTRQQYEVISYESSEDRDEDRSDPCTVARITMENTPISVTVGVF